MHPPAAHDPRGAAPTLTTVILNYNYAHFLRDAIESVLAQEPPVDQIIVIDDGSTDASMAVLDAYADRVTIHAQSNSGQIPGSRQGLALCTSTYIHFLDADDFMLPGFVEAFRRNATDDPAKVQFQMVGVDADGSPLGSVFPQFPTPYGDREMRRDNIVVGFYLCPPTSGNVYRADTLRSLDWDALDPRESVDGPIALLMPYLGPVVSVTMPVAAYRVHGDNFSQQTQPSVELMEKEISQFHTRWSVVRTLLNMTHPPYGAAEPLYVTERALIVSVLRHERAVLNHVLRFCVGVVRSGVTPRQSLALCLWALLLLVPVRPFRLYLVRLRRVAESRPASLRLIVKLTHRLTSART